MTTPALFPATMIALVALAAAHDRRDRAASLWLGMALGFSGWTLLAAAPILAVLSRRHALASTLPVAALAMSGTTFALAAVALPHSLAGLGAAPADLLAIVGTLGLALPRLHASRPLRLAQRIG